MPDRAPLRKLAVTVMPPLSTTPRFRSELLRSGATWPQDVNYLRDTYAEAYALWDASPPSSGEYDPEKDRALYAATEPLLREMLVGLDGVSGQLASRGDIFKAVRQAGYDFDTAAMYSRAGDWAMATTYQSYALLKASRLLDTLTSLANKKTAGARKLGYGYDTSGEVHEQGGTSGDDRHLWDTGNSPKFDRTPMNPANCLVDAAAESDFPELAEFKHKRVYWPPRTR